MISAYFYGDKLSSGDRELLEIMEFKDGIFPRRLTKRMYDDIIISARFNMSFCSNRLVDVMIFENDRYLFHITYFVIIFDDGEGFGYIAINTNVVRTFRGIRFYLEDVKRGY